MTATGEGPLRTARLVTAALALAAFALSCSGDLGINDYTYACVKDSDCAAGQRCDQAAGCVVVSPGGDEAQEPDTGHPADAGRDGGDAGDAGAPHDAGDAGGHPDGSADTGHDDAGDDAGLDAGHDAGRPDGGPAGDGGYVIRFSSVEDSAAGTSTAPGLILKSVTGWTAGFRWTSGGYTLQSGEPYGRQ